MINKKSLGKIGEDYACKYLISKGYEILDRNFRIGRGEIDIVAKFDKKIIFFEIKTRCNDNYMDIVDSVSADQEEKILETCEEYVRQFEIDDFQIDFLGLIINEKKILKVIHVPGYI